LELRVPLPVVVSTQTRHRDLQGAEDTWTRNVPPLNTLFRNKFSEIRPTAERPPLDMW
jgi:hypothetical protein